MININGVLLLNKQLEISSNQLLQKVKREFCAQKAGHTGSLDPLATGMLPICFGFATKFSQYMLDADKCYYATGKLGIKTNSADNEGKIIATKEFDISFAELSKVIASFLGKSQQTPPMYSALKYKGQPYYKYARNNETIPLPIRAIEISQISLLKLVDDEFTIKVICSKGTYIRTLIEDIAAKANTYAYVIKLHREYVSGFEGCRMYTLAEITTSLDKLSCLLPVDVFIKHLPVAQLELAEAKKILQGQAITFEKINSDRSSHIRLYHNDKFIGLGELNLGKILKPYKLIAANNT